jgi:undecaprenyl-phosphate 4-deoxy-4-formamido-L-arabinose transferase
MLGFLMAGFGFLFALEVIGEHFLYQQPMGWSSLMAALLVFSGTQLLVLGMAGEYIGRLYLTVNKKPQFVVKEVVRSGPPADSR